MLERRGYTDIEESKEDFTLKATKDVKKMISFICKRKIKYTRNQGFHVCYE